MTGLLMLVASPALHGQSSEPQAARELVRQTVDNEVRSNNDGTKYMFCDQKEFVHGSQTKLVVETTEATAGMLVAVDGKPLGPEQKQAEEARLHALANSPNDLRRKRKAERDDTERTERIIRALPDAFVFEEDGGELGKPGMGKNGDQLVRLKFRPNPAYDPPTHTEQVLTGMEGYVLIDAAKHRIAVIDGTLVKDVGFGWGILGHLDKGGRFVVVQGDMGSGTWEITRMDLSFTGKILLFKKLEIKSNEVFSNFRQVPGNLTFAQGVELLKKQREELAENHDLPPRNGHSP